MSAVSNSVTPTSIARWITFREASRSVRWPKLLQPRPTAETRRPEPPRLRICMIDPVGGEDREGDHCGPRPKPLQGAIAPPVSHDCAARRATAKKKRPRSDAATDGDRWGV